MKHPLWRLWRLFAPYRHWMLAGFAVALVTLLANLALLAVSGWFVTAMAIAGATGSAINYFLPAALIRAAAIVRTGGRYLERLLTHEATLRQLSGLRVWFYRHLEPLAPARLQQYHSADLFSRIRADIDALDNFYVRVLVPSLVASVAALVLWLFVAQYSGALARLLLGLWLLCGVLLPLVSRWLGAAPARALVEIDAELRQLAVDGTQGLSELLVFGAAEAHAAKLDALSARLATAQDRLGQLTGLAHGAVGLGANLALWGTLWIGIPLVAEGVLNVPQLVMLALLALASFEAVAPLPLAFQQLEATLTAAHRLFAIIDTEPAVSELSGPTPQLTHTDLQVRGLCFRYPDASTPTLSDIDFDLPAGRRLAVVGPTGSGKTTLLQLLLRFWAPERGEIRLGGHPLAALRGEDLRARLALVSQRAHLFNASIRDNLLLAAPSASQAALERACQIAQIHDFVRELPEGYATWVGETGVRLSGGQARRVAIARALLKDAPILLLDEPTEGLDGATEQALMQALAELMRGRATLLITHRPVALAEMDEILVLDQGRVVERGTHRELLGQRLYPRLLGLHPTVRE